MNISASASGVTPPQTSNITASSVSPGYVPKLTGASAARLNALLESLTQLLHQAVEEDDAAGASDGLLELFEGSPEELALLLDASLQAQRLFENLQQALQNALANNHEQISENYRKLTQALNQIQSIYQERSRRQLEQDWNFLWSLMYRQEHKDKSEPEVVLPSLPPGLPLSSAQGMLTSQDVTPGQAREILSLLSDQQSALSLDKQALLLDKAYTSLLGEVGSLSPQDTPALQEAMKTATELGEWLFKLRTALA
ncbi:MAG: hypothetical protein ACO1RX_06260 [Candidatus Sericytochromatia bacterium]